MEPWLRRHNYVEEYFNTVYNLYVREYPAFPVTYYSIDKDNTIWENENIQGGSYDKLGVGELSGVVWKKILMFPVFGVDTVQPTQDSGEKGLTFKNSMVNRIAFPDCYGIVPLEGDVVDMNFGFKNDAIRTRPLFTLANINVAHHGEDYKMWQADVQVAPFDREELEDQISTYHQFLEFSKSVIPLDNARFLLKLQERSGSLKENLDDLFDNKTGFYLRYIT